MTIPQVLFRNRSYTPIPFLVVAAAFAHPTPWSVAAGLSVAILGETIRAWGVLYVGTETRVTGDVGASRLVTSGPFARMRNPLYAGNILIYTGIGILANALTPWLQIGGFVWFSVQYSFIVREEERFLFERFGAEFESYARAVPRFFPRPTAYPGGTATRVDWRAGWESEARTLQALAAAIAIVLVIAWLR